MRRSLIAAACLLSVAGLLAACGDGPKRAAERARERQAAIDPPELWTIEVVPAQDGVRPITICTDSHVREGLARPGVTLANGPCVPTGEAVKTADGEVQRCVINGETWVATFAITGDRASDFTASLNASAVSDDSRRFSQVRRYKKLGPCPNDWAIGEATDQTGQRRRAGMANLFQ